MVPPSTHRPSHRLAAVALLVTGLVATSATAATAAGTERPAVRNPDGSVTVSVPAEQVERWCTETGPRRLDRADRVVERVRGEASVRGSADWVRARADRAEQADRPDLAARMRERADRMERTADRLDERAGRARERLERLCADGSGS